MAKTRRARIDAENGHRRVTRPRLRIIKAETQGFPTSYLRASSDTIEHGSDSCEVGYDEAKPLCGLCLWLMGKVVKRAAVPPRCEVVVGWGGWFTAGGGKKPHTKMEQRLRFVAISPRVLLFWWLLLKSTSACLGFQGPGGGSGAAGAVWALQARKKGGRGFGGGICSSLWPSLGQVSCTGQPPHRRGRVSPDKRVPPLPCWWCIGVEISMNIG